ncbi:MAG: hypothetical protein F4Z94_12870 [Chloroflexi bacterium]|nr:hypothetical protein [Chloroflexota bacterium]
MRKILIVFWLIVWAALPSLAKDKLPPPHVTSIFLVDLTAANLGWCIDIEWRHVPGADDYYIFIRGKKGLAPKTYDGSPATEARWQRRIAFNGVEGHQDRVYICHLAEQQRVKFRIRAVDSNAVDPLRSGIKSAPFALRLPKFKKARYSPQHGAPVIEVFKSAASG